MHNNNYFGIVFIVLFAFSVSLNAQWVKSYGGVYDEIANSVQQTLDGGYIVAGYTESFSVGVSESDVWILKLSASGEIEWEMVYGGNEYDKAYSIEQTLDGGYIVAGETQSFGAGGGDFWILKLSFLGDIEWQKTYGGDNMEMAASVQQTLDGGYIVAGETQSFGAEGNVFWILKLSSIGDIEWQKTFGQSGFFDEEVSIQQTSDGGYIVAGDYLFSGEEIIVIKLSPQGEIEWQKAYGGSGWDSFHSMGLTVDGGYIVAGRTESFGQGGRASIWIFKLSHSGEIDWQKTYGGADNFSAYSIEQTLDGGYIVAGDNRLFGANPSNLWIIKLWNNGDVEWQKLYGAAFNDYAQAIQQTYDGGYIVAGGTRSFGTGVHKPINGLDSDFWLLKLNPNGADSFCGLLKQFDVEVTDTDASALDLDLIPQFTNIEDSNSNAVITQTNSTVFDFCAGQYILAIKAISGGTTNPPAGRYYFEPGSEVIVTAIPENEDFWFGSWLGDEHSASNPVTITMDRHKSIRPNYGFDTSPYTPPQFDIFGGGDNCFIATAAFDSPFHPFVKTLQKFRDIYLMSNKQGRKFVDFYYKYSPPIAELITNHKILKIAVRIWLVPIVAMGYSMVHFGPFKTSLMLALTFMPLFFFVWFYRRRSKKNSSP
ncbi:MAG: hypothetical protein MUP98_13520 [Candidatus Aminicenantes bacterium]|nr:hypothetical protein [Candidatus Aminicenantes bacterium]